MKPLIGIGSDLTQPADGERVRTFAFATYTEAVRRAGGMPVVITPQEENAEELLARLDGLLLAGGDDFDPRVYGEELHPSTELMDPSRQSNDLALARAARKNGVPTLGVCLGLQVMNVAAGGSLIQDIDSQHGTEINHVSPSSNRGRHVIEVLSGTGLAAIVSPGQHDVNSSHHQAVKGIGAGLRTTARATDGIVEGLEDPSHPFYLGVQWHPEDMVGEKSAAALFDAFIEAARAHARQRREATELSPAAAGRAE
jgi:putative glutamine amidotransferase